MNITINIVEAASIIAHDKLTQHYEDLGENRNFDFPNGIEIEDEEEVVYTEEAQVLFDEYYDEIYNILFQIKYD